MSALTEAIKDLESFTPTTILVGAGILSILISFIIFLVFSNIKGFRKWTGLISFINNLVGGILFGTLLETLIPSVTTELLNEVYLIIGGFFILSLFLKRVIIDPEVENYDYRRSLDDHEPVIVEFENEEKLLAFNLFLIFFYNLLLGISLGLQNDNNLAIKYSLGVLAFNLLEYVAFSVGYHKSRGWLKEKKVWFYLSVLIIPVGIAGGILIRTLLRKEFMEDLNITNAWIGACIAGTWLYISTIEVVADDLQTYENRKYKLLIFTLGFGVTVGLRFLLNVL